MRTTLKYIALILGALLLIGAALLAYGSAQFRSAADVPDHDLTVPSDSATLAVGQRLVRAYACEECHGAGLSGTDFLDGMPFMTLPAPNLTGRAFTNAELERATRHGIGAGGQPLVIMPSKAFSALSDEDLGAMVGYIQSLARSESSLSERRIGLAGRIAAATGADLFSERSIDHGLPHPIRVTEQGPYLGHACKACHGDDLSGAMFEGTEMWAPNLTSHESGLGAWTEAAFVTAVTEGRTPDGRALDNAGMPWRAFASFSAEELSALWTYLRSLPAVDSPGPE